MRSISDIMAAVMLIILTVVAGSFAYLYVSGMLSSGNPDAYATSDVVNNAWDLN